MSDQYEKWERMLAGEKVEVNPNPEDAIPGFYRSRRGKGAPFEAVSIFRDTGGALVALRAGEPVEIEHVWPGCSAHPIKYEEYERVVDQGLPWSDQDEAVSQIAVIGDNSNAVAELSPHELLAKEIEIAESGVGKYTEINDDETEKRAQSLRSKLLELGGEADKKREAEKRPHLEAGRQVDKTWMPLVERAKKAADVIRAAMSVWETKKLRAEREAQRIREEQARAAAAAGQPPPAEPVAPPAPPRMAAPIKGASGRAASPRLVKVATIIDQAAVYEFMKDHPDVKKVLADLAQIAVNAGQTVPGVTVEEQRRVA